MSDLHDCPRTGPTTAVATSPTKESEIALSPKDRSEPKGRRLVPATTAVGLVASLIAGIATSPPTLWGLLPVVFFSLLTLLGMDILIATAVSVMSVLLMLLPAPSAIGDMFGASLGETVTMIGVIIMLGAGTGEILRITGTANTIVKSMLRVTGDKSPKRAILGIMLVCLVLVAALGTLAGALAVVAPLLLPVAARLGFTRSATAAMMFLGGSAGLAVAPFAGTNVAIMTSAGVSYPQYLLYGAAPLAVLSVIGGMIVIPWVQRRTENTGDEYDGSEVAETDGPTPGIRRTRATVAFAVTLAVCVGYAIAAGAGTSFPLLALPVIAVVTGVAGGLPVLATMQHVIRGASTQLRMFFLFWLMAVFFIAIDHLKPFDVLRTMFNDDLGSMSPLAFVAVIALLGMLGAPGAAAAHVVLLDKVFGDLATSIGVSANAWVIVLLFASKLDTYGPFPNGNMVGAMGLARSSNLRNLLVTGVLILVPATLLYAVILVFELR
ncbi:Na+/H+ antiporter NhaC family protein [Streptomyces phaeochromogenes]